MNVSQYDGNDAFVHAESSGIVNWDVLSLDLAGKLPSGHKTCLNQQNSLYLKCKVTNVAIKIFANLNNSKFVNWLIITTSVPSALADCPAIYFVFEVSLRGGIFDFVKVYAKAWI